VHEVGHAIVGTLLPGLDPVHKVSIVGRGFGALGYTMHLPSEDRYLRTRAELLNELAVLLGGRTAEMIVFGEMSTGAQNDLLRATDIARAMVTELGMSEAVGPVNHEGRRRSTFLDQPFMPERGVYAEDTARVIDAEVRRFVSGAEETARTLLSDHRGALDAVAERLLDKETIEGDELRTMLADSGVPMPAGQPSEAPAGDTAGPVI
jgi:cell division protease FtsH